MKVFVTGATGGSGTALIPKLVAAGHTVTGLARSDASAKKVASLGATPIKGDIDDLPTCASAAASADAVVHLAFDHEMGFGGDPKGACAKDRAVIKAMCDALVPTPGKVFIVCSGTLGLQGSVETDPVIPNNLMPRHESTELAFSYADKGLRVVQVRLAPITYRAGDNPADQDTPHEFIKMQVAQGRKDGYVAYLDNSFWPACTYEDSADVFVAALETGNDKVPNPVNYHAIAESGVPLKDVAEKIGKTIGVPAKRIEASEAMQLGFIGMLMTQMNEASSAWTKDVLHWKPTGRGLLDQMDRYTLKA